MDKLLLSSIKQVNKLLQDQTILPSRLTQVCIQRAKRVNKHLNSFVRITEDLAVQQSKESDERKKSNGRKGQLDGIPIAVKDNFCTKGIHTTCSSRMLEHFVPTYSATVYKRLQNSGAILIGKCNLDQFGMGSGTVDSIHGPTKNVWGSSLMKTNQDDNSQLWRIAGGSSGGSAIAVATGSCFAALGSDTGGSTRNPASYCGVIGFKPSYGLVSRHGLIPLVNSMDVPGILTRTVNDCTTVLNCIAGPDVLDSTTISHPFTDISLPELPSIQGLRVGIPMEYHCMGLSSEVNAVWSKVADLMENAGAIVKQVSLPNTSASIAVYSILNVCEVSSNMARYDGIEFGLRPLHKNNKERSEIESTEELYAESRSQGLNAIVRNRIIAGNFFLLARNYNKYFQQAMKVRRLISDDFKKVFHFKDLNSDPVDVLLTPTTLTKSPLFSEFVKKNNRDQCAVQDFCTQPANMAGVPAISIPITLSSDMLPLSLQLMGPYLSERKLLSAAKWIEQAVQYPGLPTNVFSDELDQIG